MARVGVAKKKPRATALNRIKEELRRVTEQLACRECELAEALEHQTATAEVLGIISRSPTDVQPVLDAIVESAARVCGIDDVVLRLRDGDVMVARAHYGPVSIAVSGEELSIDRPQFRWIREHGTLHIPDVHAQTDLPRFGTSIGVRTFLERLCVDMENSLASWVRVAPRYVPSHLCRSSFSKPSPTKPS